MNKRESEFKQAGAHMRQQWLTGGQDGLMVESKSSFVAVAVLLLIVAGSGDPGWASLAGVSSVSWLTLG